MTSIHCWVSYSLSSEKCQNVKWKCESTCFELWGKDVAGNAVHMTTGCFCNKWTKSFDKSKSPNLPNLMMASQLTICSGSLLPEKTSSPCQCTNLNRASYSLILPKKNKKFHLSWKLKCKMWNSESLMHKSWQVIIFLLEGCSSWSYSKSI